MARTRCRYPVVFVAVLLLLPLAAGAQETDVTQTPNTENAGIQKSLEEQIGAGRGDVDTPGSSLFIIKRDPFRSVSRGRQISQRKFTVGQGVGPRIDDGIGDIEANPGLGAGLADSCVACHGRPRGSAGHGGNVFTRPDSRDAPHLFGLGLVEMLADEITADLRAQREAALSEAAMNGTKVTVELTSKGISYGTLTASPDGSVDSSGLDGVDPDLRVKPFFAEGGAFSIRQFSVGAFQAEMGLQAPDPDLLAASQGHRVVTPSGMVLDGSLDAIGPPPVESPEIDGDGDGVFNEIDTAITDHLEFYLLNYFKPGLYRQTQVTEKGFGTFESIGCAECHVRNLTVNTDRRVADVETVYDPENGVFNNLFATAAARFAVVEDPENPELPDFKLPSGEPFVVENIFTDFKRHDLGPNFWELNFDGTITREFMTEPLWGVGSTAPYGHDGRSINLIEVIERHGGEALDSATTFAEMAEKKRAEVLAFLESLVLFPPPDTASNLNPGDPTDPVFPQRGHGSIALSVLFNDPSDPE